MEQQQRVDPIRQEMRRHRAAVLRAPGGTLHQAGLAGGSCGVRLDPHEEALRGPDPVPVRGFWARLLSRTW